MEPGEFSSSITASDKVRSLGEPTPEKIVPKNKANISGKAKIQNRPNQSRLSSLRSLMARVKMERMEGKNLSASSHPTGPKTRLWAW